VSALSLAVLAAVAYGLTSISPHVILERIPTWLRAAGWLPVLSIPLSMLLPWLLWRSRGSPAWTPLARLHFGLLALASAVYAALLWSYHLIGLG
jgi:hypothetical protein